MRSLLHLAENLIGISQIVGMAWITKTLLDACMDATGVWIAADSNILPDAASILDSARAPVEWEWERARNIYVKKKHAELNSFEDFNNFELQNG